MHSLRPFEYLFHSVPLQLVRDWSQVHHEVELGVIIGRAGFEISEAEAMQHVGGYCLALDMTARDFLHENIIPRALPWGLGKTFETSCPVSRALTPQEVGDPHDVELWCRVNGVERQRDRTSNMIFNIPQVISYVSSFITLQPADVILTGTPAGLGPVRSGDVIECGITNVISMKFEMEERTKLAARL